ncbi:MarR family winged helix-turn-helix transcriptional regulator [Rugosimonospora africana]|uniref:MarR family transcriptional regulator n=1 Tax=Rugosimonospora africana TaxID=556532 RepID=A0A8J3QRJ6_9ACTN|nr:MarR family transcriptional regulator [Rugosimonospora africana]GIH15304.1 MarR family transcriptional regulator [Rugosimonospora africana]
MDDPRWLDESEHGAWCSYIAMHARLMAQLHRQLQHDAGLSLADYDVLSQLTNHPAGRARVFELVEALQWEQSRLSHHLKRMQGRGLVTREYCPDDGRAALVVLTPEGRSAIEHAAPRHVAAVRDLVFDVLTPDQVAGLRAVAEAVLDRIEARDDGSAAT